MQTFFKSAKAFFSGLLLLSMLTILLTNLPALRTKKNANKVCKLKISENFAVCLSALTCSTAVKVV